MKCASVCLWALLSVTQCASAQSGAGAMFRADAGRAGVFEAGGVARVRGVLWKFRTGRVVEAWFSSPTLFEGVVYFGSDDGGVYAVDARTGRERWEFGTSGAVMSSPSVAGGLVYFGASDGRLYALDAATGRRRWRFDAGESWMRSSPAVGDGVVFFGSDDGYLYALH